MMRCPECGADVEKRWASIGWALACGAWCGWWWPCASNCADYTDMKPGRPPINNQPAKEGGGYE